MEEELISKKMDDLEGLLRINMNKKFHLQLCSDVDLEGMAIYIDYGTETVASITYERGINNMEIELFPFGKSKDSQVFLLDEFINALERAKNLAIKCAKEDELREKH